MQQLQLGMQALQVGNLDIAENIFLNILATNSSEVHSLHFLGVVFCQKGNLDEGIALIDQSIRLDPSRFGPYLNLGRFLIASAQWDRAVAALEQAVQKDADSFDAWSMLAQACFFAGSAATALKAGKRAAEINSGNAELFFSLGVYASEMNKDEAIDYYRNALSIDPSSIKAWVNLGNCMLDCKYVEDAIAAFNKALKSDSSCFQALMGLSRAYGNLGQWVESLAIAQQSLNRDPLSDAAAFMVAFSFHKLGRKQDAVNAYEYLMRLEGAKTPSNLIYAGNAYEGLGDDDKALTCYQDAFNMDGTSEEACLFQGAILSRRYDEISAERLYRNFLGNCPTSSRVLRALGSLLLGQEKLVEARDCFQKSMNLQEGDPEVIARIAEIDRREGDFENAILGYSAALKHDPTLSSCYFNLFLMLSKEDRRWDSSLSLLDGIAVSVCKSLAVDNCIAFGDSHVGIFGGIPGFEKVWVGAATAYNLIKSQSSTKGREKIFRRLESAIPGSSAVLLSFGEVDCRSNILKYCVKSGKSINEVCAEVVSRYFEFVGEIIARGFAVVICGPYGSGSDHNNQGNAQERFYSSFCMETMFCKGAKERGIPYFSLHGVLTNAELQETRLDFFDDGLHFPGHKTDQISSEVKCMVLSRMLAAINESHALSVNSSPPVVEETSLLGKSCLCLLDVFSNEKPIFHHFGVLPNASERVKVLSCASRSMVIDLDACLNVEIIKASFSSANVVGVEVWALDNKGDKTDAVINIDSRSDEEFSGVRLNAVFPPRSMLRYLVVICPEGLLSTLLAFDVRGKSFIF